jgi:hypothetical protein
MKYLVSGSNGPGFATPEEALQLLEKVVVPSLDAPGREAGFSRAGSKWENARSFSLGKLNRTKSWTGCCVRFLFGKWSDGKSLRSRVSKPAQPRSE